MLTAWALWLDVKYRKDFGDLYWGTIIFDLVSTIGFFIYKTHGG